MSTEDWRIRVARINGYALDSPAQRRAERDLEDWTPEARDVFLANFERDLPPDTPEPKPAEQPTSDHDEWRLRADRINGFGLGSPRARRAEAELEKLTPEGRDALLTGLENQ